MNIKKTSLFFILVIVFTTGVHSAYSQKNMDKPDVEYKAGVTLTPEDIIEYDVPEGWKYAKARSRWLSPDPTFKLEKSYMASIKVALYGINEDTGFSTPGALEDKIDKLLHDANKTVDTTSVAGKEAKSIQLYYEQSGFTDEHGVYVPENFVHDEFVILPLEEGFLVLNLVISWDFPMPSPSLSVEEADNDYDREVAQIFKDWRIFLKSCSFKPATRPILGK